VPIKATNTWIPALYSTQRPLRLCTGPLLQSYLTRWIVFLVGLCRVAWATVGLLRAENRELKGRVEEGVDEALGIVGGERSWR